MQICIRRSIEHHPRASIAHGVRQTITYGVVGPEDHPVRTDRYWWTCFVRGIVVAVLRCAAEHVDDDPESSFDGLVLETPWDDIHVAYFSGEALWTYLNTPFLFTWPGFGTEEIPPIKVGGETWRRLKVTFPDHIKSHTREQISCFGPDGLLRRQDYTVDILGGAPGLNYASHCRDVDGIIVPTKRRIYGWKGDYQLVPAPLLIAIDMGEITIR